MRRQERMIMPRIFSSAEPDPQLTWTAMICDEYNMRLSGNCHESVKVM